MLFGLVAAFGALLVVVWIAYVTADRPDEAAPEQRVRWDALNTGAIEDEVRRRLTPDAELDPTLADLARHHAFDMSARGFSAEQSPEGEDHRGRRRRLAARFVGTTVERRVLFAREPGTREEAIGAQAADRLAATEVPARPAAGIGAAAEGGQCAVVVVVGRRVATLDEAPITGVAAGLWTLRGTTVDGLGSADLAVESRSGGGPWQTQGSSRPVENQLGDPDPRAFEVEVDVPGGQESFEVRLLHDGDEVLVVPIRD